MYKIRLNDGTEFPARFCSARGGILTLGIITAANFLTVATKFCTAAQSVTYCYDGEEERFIGYTKPLAITTSIEGEFEVSLRKE